MGPQEARIVSYGKLGVMRVVTSQGEFTRLSSIKLSCSLVEDVVLTVIAFRMSITFFFFLSFFSSPFLLSLSLSMTVGTTSPT